MLRHAPSKELTQFFKSGNPHNKAPIVGIFSIYFDILPFKNVYFNLCSGYKRGEHSESFCVIMAFFSSISHPEGAPYIHRTAKPEQPTVGMEPLSKSNGSPLPPPFRYKNRQAEAFIFLRKFLRYL